MVCDIDTSRQTRQTWCNMAVNIRKCVSIHSVKIEWLARDAKITIKEYKQKNRHWKIHHRLISIFHGAIILQNWQIKKIANVLLPTNSAIKQNRIIYNPLEPILRYYKIWTKALEKQVMLVISDSFIHPPWGMSPNHS